MEHGADVGGRIDNQLTPLLVDPSNRLRSDLHLGTPGGTFDRKVSGLVPPQSIEERVDALGHRVRPCPIAAIRSASLTRATFSAGHPERCIRGRNVRMPGLRLDMNTAVVPGAA